MTFQVIQMAARTLSWWRDERDDVDLEPIYQRKGHVWSDRQKQYLIDSILNGFDVPKLYFADFTFLNGKLNPKKKKYAVIDGKQRLLAIYDFFEGRVKLPKRFIYIEDPAIKIGGFSYSDLVTRHPRIARKFDNASLTVMSVITDDESKINELFVRLNSSKPLTGAELRNAMTGKLPEIIRELVDTEFFRSRIKFNVARSQDKNTAAKLLLLEHRGTIVDTKKAQLDALVTEAGEDPTEIEANLENELIEAIEETENEDIKRSAANVKTVLGRMAAIFKPEDPLLRQQAQIVVVYWVLRSIPDRLLGHVRPFLESFEADRQANKISGNLDTDIDEFELMARTSNDSSSISRRVEIVQSRFIDYLTEKGVSFVD